MNQICNNPQEIKNQSLDQKKYYQNIKEDILNVIKEYPGAIRYFEDEYKTEEMCKIAMRDDPKLFKYVPKHLQKSDF